MNRIKGSRSILMKVDFFRRAMTSDKIILYLFVGFIFYRLLIMGKDKIRFKKISKILNFKIKDYSIEENGALKEWGLIYVYLDRRIVKCFKYSDNVAAFLTYEFEDRLGSIEFTLIDWRIKVLRPFLNQDKSKKFLKDLKLSKENIFASYMDYSIDSYLIYSKEKSISDFEIKSTVEQMNKDDYFHNLIFSARSDGKLNKRDNLLETVKSYIAEKNSSTIIENVFLSEILKHYKNFKSLEGFDDVILKNEKSINESFNKYLEKIKNKDVRDYFLRK